MRTATMRSRLVSPLGLLIALAVAQAALYLFGLTARYPLAQGLATPGVSWPNFYSGSLGAGAVHALVYALLTGCYVLALAVVKRIDRLRRGAVSVVVAGWLLASLVLLWAYPGESLDVLSYVFRGRMLFLHGASPLAVTPDAFPELPFYEYIGWRDWVDTYGPLWEYASGATAGAVSATGSTSLVANVTGYRLLAIGLSGVCAVLIALLVRHTQPALVPAALLAWLWNPLVLVSTSLGAHNDVLMLVLLLLTLVFAQRRRWLWAWLALWLAAHVKLTALLLVPVLGLWLARRRGWLAATGISLGALAVALPLSWLLYAPLGGWETLPRMLRERTRLIYNSPANIVYGELQLRWGWHEPAAREAVVLGSTLLFAVLAAVLLVGFWHRSAAHAPAEETLWRACVGINLAYLLVGSFWFQSWYVLWVLAFAALLPSSRWPSLLALYSLGALWSNLVTDWGNRAPGVAALTVYWSMVATLLAPLLCVLLFMLARRTRGPRTAAAGIERRFGPARARVGHAPAQEEH